MAKPLYKIREGRIISGVCAGLAEYFNIDVNLVRICAVLIGFAGGAGVIVLLATQNPKNAKIRNNTKLA